MYISNLSRSLDLRLATVTLQKYGKSELRPLLCFRGKLEGSCTGTETNRRQKMTNIRHRVTSQNNRSPTSHIGLPLWRDCEEITDCSPLYETTREKNSQFSPLMISSLGITNHHEEYNIILPSGQDYVVLLLVVNSRVPRHLHLIPLVKGPVQSCLSVQVC